MIDEDCWPEEIDASPRLMKVAHALAEALQSLGVDAGSSRFGEIIVVGLGRASSAFRLEHPGNWDMDVRPSPFRGETRCWSLAVNAEVWVCRGVGPRARLDALHDGLARVLADRDFHQVDRGTPEGLRPRGDGIQSTWVRKAYSMEEVAQVARDLLGVALFLCPDGDEFLHGGALDGDEVEARVIMSVPIESPSGRVVCPHQPPGGGWILSDACDRLVGPAGELVATVYSTGHWVLWSGGERLLDGTAPNVAAARETVQRLVGSAVSE